MSAASFAPAWRFIYITKSRHVIHLPAYTCVRLPPCRIGNIKTPPVFLCYGRSLLAVEKYATQCTVLALLCGEPTLETPSSYTSLANICANGLLSRRTCISCRSAIFKTLFLLVFGSFDFCSGSNFPHQEQWSLSQPQNTKPRV